MVFYATSVDDLRKKKLQCGAVGSGKSSLLMAIIGVMPHNSGVASVRGSIALVTQQAWILSETLRANILFGKPFDSVLYNTVVDICTFFLGIYVVQMLETLRSLSVLRMALTLCVPTRPLNARL